MLATVIPFSPWQLWAVRIFDFVPLQIIAFLLISLVLYFVFLNGGGKWEKALLMLMLIALIVQVVKVRPYTIFHSKHALDSERNSDKKNQLSIIYCNVLMENRRDDMVLSMIRKMDPDIILAVETDKWWDEKLKVLKDAYPYSVSYPQENTYGMILYSRLPLERLDIHFLVEDDVPSMNPLVTLPSGKKINCYFIHPRPPVPGERETSRERDAELIVVGKSARNSELPVIVAGDLNDVGWSQTSILFQKVSNLLDPRIGRGLFATFNAKNPIMRWPLDHVFHSKEFRVVELKKLDYVGSDHFPIYVKLSYEPDGQYEHQPRNAKEQDFEDADEKVKKVE